MVLYINNLKLNESYLPYDKPGLKQETEGRVVVASLQLHACTIDRFVSSLGGWWSGVFILVLPILFVIIVR